jgi:nitrogen fixation protein FixH
MMNQQTRHFTGRHMLIIMVSFFAVIFTANMCLVYYANHSWTGLVVQNSYVASQEFNATTQKLEQAAADFHATLNYQNGKLKITLRDNSGKAANIQNVVARLGRPSHEGEDKSIALSGSGDGDFAADIVLGRGQWSGAVSADVIGRTLWQRPIRLFVKE